MIKKIVIISSILFFFVTVLTLSASFYYFNLMPNCLKEDKLIYVAKGESLYTLSQKFEDECIIRYSKIFYYLSKIYKWDSLTVKSGEYLFTKDSTPARILQKMNDGDVYYRHITFAEGLSNDTILRMIDEAEGLEGEIPENISEGTLLPDTYNYTKGETKEALVKRMQDAMNEVLDKYWDSRDLSLPIKTKNEALILASIVEKETGIPEERKKVASVFNNRLKLGMKIQSDPTVVYSFAKGNKDLEREIRMSDLNRKSPYNTYHIYGLPPTPIANPGEEAIKATLNPDKTKYLYFVATGNGGHNFSKSLRQHINYVNQYRQIIKEKSQLQEVK